MQPELPNPKITTVTIDPPSKYRINCNSFQQDAILSFGGWQYTCFYTAAVPTGQAACNDEESISPTPTQGRWVCVGRRKLGNSQDRKIDGEWEVITLRDYVQTFEDGHNTISMGVCEGDGTVHLAFDAHCEGLKYRRSRNGIVSEIAEGEWKLGNLGFSDVPGMLPGCEDDEDAGVALGEMTYPRFISVDNGELLFECRVGRAGNGSCVLFRYQKDKQGKWRWRFVGRYLVGVECSAYVNWVSWEPSREGGKGRIHVSWTNRHWVDHQDDNVGKEHAQQAGPNGPENNKDLGYAWSGDGGWTWLNSRGVEVADLKRDRMKGVLSTGREVLAVEIPKDSGIMNQEGQCVNVKDGTFHVLMRDTRLTGSGCVWRHSWKDLRGEWYFGAIEANGVKAEDVGSRGKVVADGKDGSVWFVLPGNVDDSLTVGRRLKTALDGNVYGDFEVIWRGDGFDGEPLIDERLWRDERRLSVMTRTAGEDGERRVVVLDFDHNS